MPKTKRVLLCVIVLVLMLVSVNSASLADSAGKKPIVRFTPFVQNPVITRTATENWGGDCGTIFAPHVIKYRDQYVMFYTGSCNRQGRPAAVGFATSTDGIQWNKHDKNPILAPDGNGYDAMCVSHSIPLLDGDQWVLYYAANAQPCAGPGRSVGRATAPSLAGPWKRSEEPVLVAGKPGEWDEGFVTPHAVIRTDQGYVMYYSSGSEFLLPLPHLVGLATSPDGLTWTKYNNPSTSDARYLNSDPILEIKDDGSTAPLAAWAIDVVKTTLGWEMFFSGVCPNATQSTCPGFIAYATSQDGIRWKPYREPESLVLTPKETKQKWSEHCVCYPSVIRETDGYRLYYTGCTSEENNCQIGLATGTIVWSK